MKVYLGGIGNESNWRDAFFTESAGQSIETVDVGSEGKKECDLLLYVVTPKMNEFSTIIDVVNDSNHDSSKTIFCSINEEQGDVFTSHQIKSITAIGKMIEANGGKWFNNLSDTIAYIKQKS
jgi:hypothetical protein